MKKNINKGAPSGFVISLIFHAAAFFIAGLFVVFTVVIRDEPEFQAPPPIERPKMKLKKPKVKVKKSSQPKPSSRIVAKVQTREMPEIQLPDLMGTGEGLLGGSGFGGEFLDLPEIGDLSAFGSEVSTGNDLIGMFYDLKRTRDGRRKDLARDDIYMVYREFLKDNWDEGFLSQYYRSPKKLYTSCICVGTVLATVAPRAFGEETGGWAWCVLYHGKLVYHKDIKFRFRGVGDKILAVRVDGEVVLLSTYNSDFRNQYFSDIWNSRAPDNRVYPMGENNQEIGDWIELKAGVPKDIDVLVGDDVPGGLVYFQLAVEVEGEEYPRNPFMGGPTLPAFKTDMLTRAQLDAIYPDVYPGDIDLTNSLVFCDYPVNPVDYDPPLKTNAPDVFVEDWIKAPRAWTSKDGKTLNGTYLLHTSEYVIVLQNGEQRKVPLNLLSDADLEFLALARPPEFKIEFYKTSRQLDQTHLNHPDANVNDPRPLSVFEYTFGAKLNKSSSGEYEHELTVEYCAIGQQVNDNDKFILLDRKAEKFIPSRKNNYSLEFHGKPLRIEQFAYRSGASMHGREPAGYLIVVRDKAGRIVQYKTSNEFLFKNLWKLKQYPVNVYFDKNGDRTYPARPIDADRGPGVYND